MFHLKTTVKLYGGDVDVSTIELREIGFETCVFLSDERSDVVERYGTAEEAALGHLAWSRPAVASMVRELKMYRDRA
jgi:hypothetical protein